MTEAEALAARALVTGDGTAFGRWCEGLAPEKRKAASEAFDRICEEEFFQRTADAIMTEMLYEAASEGSEETAEACIAMIERAGAFGNYLEWWLHDGDVSPIGEAGRWGMYRLVADAEEHSDGHEWLVRECTAMLERLGLAGEYRKWKGEEENADG